MRKEVSIRRVIKYATIVTESIIITPWRTLPTCIYHIYWNDEEVALFLDKIMPICKSLALNKKGRKVLLSHTRHRKFRVCYLISLRREWSYNILVEEDQKYNSNPIEALLFSGGVYGCVLSTFHFQITPLHPGPSKSHFEKKNGSNILLFSEMQHWSTKYTIEIYVFWYLSFYPSPRISS